MIIRNSRYKEVLPDTIAYKGQTYTKAYAKGKLLFASADDDYEYQYFTVESLEDGNVITLTIPEISTITSVSWSKDGTTWTTFDQPSATTITVEADASEKVYWKGIATTYSSSQNVYSNITATKTHHVSGNIMSLLYGDGFVGMTTFPNGSNYNFGSLFRQNANLIDAKHLILPANDLKINCYKLMFNGCTALTAVPELPATNLASSCYYCMFQGCTSLTTAPTLPATTLASYCYYCMFQRCTSLVSAPVLPATTLATYCYYGMFRGCTSMITSPSLPALALAENCYQYMFSGCTSLSYIKCLATDISASGCTTDWVNNVASSGTFVKADNMTSWLIDSVDGIPIGWTVQDYIEDYEQEYFTIESLEDNNTITATLGESLAIADFASISYSIDDGITWTTLTNDGATTQTISVTINAGEKVLWKGSGNRTATNNAAKYSTKFSSTGDFNLYGNIMSLIKGDNFAGDNTITALRTFNLLFQDCDKLIDASNFMLTPTKLTFGCYYCMFQRCSSMIKPPKLPATTLANQCYWLMFQGCTSLTEAPELPATTLAVSCYQTMFDECASLVKAPKLPATTLANQCYGYMFRYCRSLTEAPELPAPTLTQQCYQNMFNGCTSLNYIKCLATDISATDCTTNWVNNVASTGTFVKADGMNDWTIDSVNGIPTGWTVRENSNFTTQYFTIESLEDGNEVKFTKHSGVSTTIFQSISYSTDGTNWTTIQNVDNQPIDQSLGILNNGDKMYFKGSASAYATGNVYGNVWRYSTLITNKTCNVYGNIMSLLYGDNFSGQTRLTEDYAFLGLFARGNVVSAANLVLSATNMTFCCYKYLFSNNKTLTAAPVLTSTSLADQCYEGMFSDCTSLTTAPALPATTTVGASYQYMFSGCTSLTTAPALPATTLSQWCYRGMFENCTALSAAPALAVNYLESQCYEGMFKGCTSLQSVTLPATSLGWACYFHMLEGCTSLETIDLPATTIVEYCYDSMLAKCTGLKSISVHAVTSGYSIDFGSELSASGTYYVPRTATGYILSACPTGWTISKTLS